MSFVKKLLTSKKPNQTVFSFADLSGAVAGYSGAKLKSALKYAVGKKDLIRISRGIYCFSNGYSRQEFANKYRTPSYISLYTVLLESGIVFQPYSSIYLVANRSQETEIDGQKYIYRKIRDEISLNPLGINSVDNIYKAGPERAICDKLYLDGDEHFDNLRSVDWNLMLKLNQQVYQNPVISSFIAKHAPHESA